MPAEATLTADQKRTQYAKLAAAEIVLDWLLQEVEIIPGLDDAVDTHLVGATRLYSELFNARADEAFSRDPVHITTEAFVAQAFARMATADAREFFLDRAGYFAGLVAKNTAGREFGDA